MDDDLKCELCNLNFHSINLKPMALPCGHTFCYKCIAEKSNKSYIECKKCKKLHFLKSDQIPPNYFIMNILEKMEEKQRKDSRNRIKNIFIHQPASNINK
jgi:hypothetical protein